MWSVWLVFCDHGFHSVCPLMDKYKRLVEASWWERNLGLVLMGGAMLSKSLIQNFLLMGGALFPPCCLAWGQTMVGVITARVTSFKRTLFALLYSVPLTLQQASAGDCWTLKGKSGSVSCGYTAPFSWLLVHTRFYLCPPRVCFPSPVEVLSSNPTGLQNQISWGFSVPLPDPQVEKSVVGPRTFLINSVRISLV